MKKYIMMFMTVIVCLLFLSEQSMAQCCKGRTGGLFQRLKNKRTGNSCSSNEAVETGSYQSCQSCQSVQSSQQVIVSPFSQESVVTPAAATQNCINGNCPVPNNTITVPATNYIPAPEPALPTKPVIRKKASIDVNAAIPSEITVMTNAQIPVLD